MPHKYYNYLTILNVQRSTLTFTPLYHHGHGPPGDAALSGMYVRVYSCMFPAAGRGDIRVEGVGNEKIPIFNVPGDAYYYHLATQVHLQDQ